VSGQKNTPEEEPVAIPVDALSEEALKGIIKDFVLREGTDYGERDYSLDSKIEAVKKQLARGDAQVLYDAATESCTIALRGSFNF
jgi:hypothetical protein